MYKQNSPYIMNSSFVFVCSKNVGKNRITVFIILNFPRFAHGTKYTCILLSDKNNIVFKLYLCQSNYNIIISSFKVHCDC